MVCLLNRTIPACWLRRSSGFLPIPDYGTAWPVSPGPRLSSVFPSIEVPGNCFLFFRPEAFGRRVVLLSEAVGATADPQIPSLGAVLNPIELRKHLKIFTRAPWRWQNLGDVQVRALRFHSGRRCTVEIIVCTSAGAQTLVGKVYAQNGLPIYHAMQRLSQGGFGPEAEFSVPTPLAFSPELQFLLQEK